MRSISSMFSETEEGVYDDSDSNTEADATFKFTESFKKIKIKKGEEQEESGRSLHTKLLGAVCNVDTVFGDQEENPNVNKNASFSMKEFDRLCRNFSDVRLNEGWAEGC